MLRNTSNGYGFGHPVVGSSTPACNRTIVNSRVIYSSMWNNQADTLGNVTLITLFNSIHNYNDVNFPFLSTGEFLQRNSFKSFTLFLVMLRKAYVSCLY